MSEIETYREPSALNAQMDYARAVSTGSMLPDAYRGKPADILIAVGLGQAMGLSPAESLYRIAVIKGKPTASAELIAAQVRKAGHKLRVKGDDQTCTATIIRADDPDFPFEVTRDLAWARGMGLDAQPNYKKQPGTMLQWRAITAVARLACPEALYGVQYTPDEVESAGWDGTTAAPRQGGLAAALSTEPGPVATNDAEPIDGEVIEDAETGEAMTDRTRGELFANFSERGIEDRAEQIAGIVHIIGRQIESRSELTDAEARRVIATLKGKS